MQANHLITETSPYLLQHAYQPVNWYPYSEKVFELSRANNKPLIISIGYSTCHWCHVMAHECFDDLEVAEVMNKYFISVKVDREELPDVDKYYMNVMQVLTGRGGWPLNVFVLPDKKAFYAVTYLPKHQWIDLLNKIHTLYSNDYQKLQQYANDLHQNIKHFELAGIYQNHHHIYVDLNKLKEKVDEWKMVFDKEWGGTLTIPKFVMPVNYKFLMQYSVFLKDEEVKKHIYHSIKNIILGGLFDHIGGGFYRYSTDRFWKIPHFEKMLYDNAQMIELLSLYYLHQPDEEIKWIIQKTIDCVLYDFYSEENVFYSAWDADSDNQEGKFYIWTLQELKNILKEEYDEFAHIFNLSNNFGYWENDAYVLTINMNLFNENKSYWINKINTWTKLLNTFRKKRTPPSIDTKNITSWNALMIKALCTASLVFNEPSYLSIAQKTIDSLLDKVYIKDKLYRVHHQSQSKISAYLDDYAFLIDALIMLFKTTVDINYITIAQKLADTAIDEFYVSVDKLFYYTSAQHSHTHVELYDDVIPSANAQMIKNLFYLTYALNHTHYEQVANNVFNTCIHLFYTQPQHTASYGMMILEKLFYDKTEICISGPNSLQYLNKIYPQISFINNIYVASEENNLPIFQNRFHSNKTFIYVCRHSTCYEPIETTDMFNFFNYL